MLHLRISGEGLRIGHYFEVTFQRTLRIPDNERTYPLPPGLGAFPIRRVRDYATRVPASWRERGGVMIPMYQREAMWLSFAAPDSRPCAVQISVGNVNAITGEERRRRLRGGSSDTGGTERALRRIRTGTSGAPQNYIVCPDQPWLDGINAGDGFIRQFVAMPLGKGYTVEGQVTGREDRGGLQIRVFEPKPGRVPGRPPAPRGLGLGAIVFDACCACAAPAPEMGLAAGGRMRQRIYPDRYGLDTWDETRTGRIFVHIVNSLAWKEITGEPVPPSPVTVESYIRAGLPWFDLYDEHMGDVPSSKVLAGVRSVAEIEAAKGTAPQPGELTVDAGSGGWQI